MYCVSSCVPRSLTLISVSGGQYHPLAVPDRLQELNERTTSCWISVDPRNSPLIQSSRKQMRLASFPFSSSQVRCILSEHQPMAKNHLPGSQKVSHFQASTASFAICAGGLDGREAIKKAYQKRKNHIFGLRRRKICVDDIRGHTKA